MQFHFASWRLAAFNFCKYMRMSLTRHAVTPLVNLTGAGNFFFFTSRQSVELLNGSKGLEIGRFGFWTSCDSRTKPDSGSDSKLEVCWFNDMSCTQKCLTSRIKKFLPAKSLRSLLYADGSAVWLALTPELQLVKSVINGLWLVWFLDCQNN